MCDLVVLKARLGMSHRGCGEVRSPWYLPVKAIFTAGDMAITPCQVRESAGGQVLNPQLEPVIHLPSQHSALVPGEVARRVATSKQPNIKEGFDQRVRYR